MSDEVFHGVDGGRVIPAARLWRGFRALRARDLGFLALCAAPALGGCAVSMPIGAMTPADAVTGSFSDVPFGQLLDEEDRRRERAALATALDLQGDGSAVHWENPKSGHKGTITAAGHAYPSDTKICRGFTGDLTHKGAARSTQGTACIVTAGEWAVKTGVAPKKG